MAQRGWRGIIILITPVFRDWNNACTSSAGSVQKHTVKIVVSFSSSSLKRLRIFNRELNIKKNESNLNIMNTNGLIQNRHMRCIDKVIKFDMNKCLNNQKKITNWKFQWTKSLLVSGLVTSNGEPWRDGRKTQPDHPWWTPLLLHQSGPGSCSSKPNTHLYHVLDWQSGRHTFYWDDR